MTIRYEVNGALPSSDQVLELFELTGISSALWTPERMDRALRGTAVVACAWSGETLVGFGRAISDMAWIAYISQLAVHPEHQRKRIGRELVEKMRRALGEEVALLVHSADDATGFYEAVGFNPYSKMYRLGRSK